MFGHPDKLPGNRFLAKVSRIIRPLCHWLKNPRNLTREQEDQLEKLKRLDLKTARANHIKQALARYWELKEPVRAALYLKRWYFWATHSWLKPIIEVARAIKRYWNGVLSFTTSRTTNSVVEGLNSKIKTAMKRLTASSISPIFARSCI